MAAYLIVENLYAQVDQEGNRFILIESITNTRTNGTQTLQQDVFVISNSGAKREKVQLKDGKSASNGRISVLHGTILNI